MNEVSEVNGPYTIAEVSRLMGLSPRYVTQLFEREPGVIIYEVKRPRKRASYRTIRIPRHVYARVIRRYTV